MQTLDVWTEKNIINPLREAWETAQGAPDEGAILDHAVSAIKKAIREKVLESYRNGQGQKAKPADKQSTRRRAGK